VLIKASDCSAGPDVAKASPVFLEKMLGIAKRYRDVCYIYIILYNYICILVGGFKHVLFSIIYGIILPIDFHSFQDG